MFEAQEEGSSVFDVLVPRLLGLAFFKMCICSL